MTVDTNSKNMNQMFNFNLIFVLLVVDRQQFISQSYFYRTLLLQLIFKSTNLNLQLFLTPRLAVQLS